MKARGFTLIELLIAASIFSLIALSIYSAFGAGLSSYKKIDSALALDQKARLLLNKIELDLKNSFIYSDSEVGFKGDEKGIDFFAVIDSYAAGEYVSSPCRLNYELAGKVFQRRCYPVLDISNADSESEEKTLSFDIADIAFEYACAKDDPDQPYEWQASWPTDDSQKNILPLAVKIKLFLPVKEGSLEKQAEAEEIEFSKIVSLPLAG